MARVPARPRARVVASAAAFALASLALVPRARAQGYGEGEERWRFAAGVETDFPVDVAARLEAEAPFRLRLSTSFGFLPHGYMSAINGVLTSANAYDDATGQLITSTLSSSFVWRTHVGYRPFRKLGFYTDVGYGMVSLGGAATAGTILESVTGQQLPAEYASYGTRAFSTKATLHMLDVEIGWAFVIADHLQLRTALGGAFTFASSTTITPDFAVPNGANLSPFLTYGENYLNNIFTSYVFTPVVTIGAAYEF